MSADWWAASPDGRLSQGDVFAAFPTGASLSPPSFVGTAPFEQAKGRVVWPVKGVWTADGDGLGHFVSRGRLAPIIVLSHSCELDKAIGTEGRIGAVVAPLRPIASVRPEDREAVLNGDRLALFPLAALPQLGDHYADLRSIVSVQVKNLRDLTRVASMTEEGVLALQSGVAGYFTRRMLGFDRGAEPGP